MRLSYLHMPERTVGSIRSSPALSGAALSKREREVMSLIVEGRTSKEIARLLVISVSTVRKHRENLLRRLGLHSTAQLISRAIGSLESPNESVARSRSDLPFA
jgi:DNA-binding NarL/FixJ family response regulator